MNTRTFFLASVLAAIVAICLQHAGLGLHSQGVIQWAKFVGHAKSVGATGEQKQQMRAEVHRCAAKGEFLAGVGLASAGLSVACLAVSIRRHESGRRSIPITLLICYLLFLLVVV